MQTFNLEVAGEYLVMASTLTYLKSRMLLPKHEREDEEGGEEGEDPREELIAKLIEYKKYKEAALALRDREMAQSRVFTRPPSAEAPAEGDLLLEVSVFELLKSFRKVLEGYGGPRKIAITLEEISVTDKINEIMSRLEGVDHLTFDALFETGRTRMEVVATFLALLEVIRLRLVKVHQARAGGQIIIMRAPEEEPSAGDEPDGEPSGDNHHEPEDSE
ncbi:MAG: segregation/condensation protein A [Nitrospinae bacterium]|nr:segregation/condensation protein A [Nitrospinota bacterium]